MTFSEPYSTLVLAIAVLDLIIDFWADGDRRNRMVSEHQAWWDRLQTVTHSQLIWEAASGFYGIPTIKITDGRSQFFHIATAIVAVGVATILKNS